MMIHVCAFAFFCTPDAMRHAGFPGLQAVLPLCWLRSMAVMSWFSFLGVLSSISLVISIVAFSMLGTCDGGSNCSNVEHPDPREFVCVCVCVCASA